MLSAGMVIGSLATMLWQGMQSADGGVGTGIRKMIDQSRQRDQASIAKQGVSEADKPVKQQTDFDFFTVLPEIEVLVPTVESDPSSSDPPPPKPHHNTNAQAITSQPRAVANSAYMLQAGSYKNKVEADRLRAELALTGLVSSIQKVTIQGKGDFFRVRLGPYSSYRNMVKADEKLAGQGIKTLRLKISRDG